MESAEVSRQIKANRRLANREARRKIKESTADDDMPTVALAESVREELSSTHASVIEELSSMSRDYKQHLRALEKWKEQRRVHMRQVTFLEDSLKEEDRLVNIKSATLSKDSPFGSKNTVDDQVEDLESMSSGTSKKLPVSFNRADSRTSSNERSAHSNGFTPSLLIKHESGPDPKTILDLRNHRHSSYNSAHSSQVAKSKSSDKSPSPSCASESYLVSDPAHDIPYHQRQSIDNSNTSSQDELEHIQSNSMINALSSVSLRSPEDLRDQSSSGQSTCSNVSSTSDEGRVYYVNGGKRFGDVPSNVDVRPVVGNSFGLKTGFVSSDSTTTGFSDWSYGMTARLVNDNDDEKDKAEMQKKAIMRDTQTKYIVSRNQISRTMSRSKPVVRQQMTANQFTRARVSTADTLPSHMKQAGQAVLNRRRSSATSHSIGPLPSNTSSRRNSRTKRTAVTAPGSTTIIVKKIGDRFQDAPNYRYGICVVKVCR